MSREWVDLRTAKFLITILFKMACSGPPRDTEEVPVTLFETEIMRRSVFFLAGELSPRAWQDVVGSGSNAIPSLELLSQG
jgi:hypothetical protein